MKGTLQTWILGAAALGAGPLAGGAAAQSAPAMAGMPMSVQLAAKSALRAPALALVQGWVQAAPPGAEELSVYLVLRNPGRAAVTLVGASTPIAGQAMLMTTGTDAAGRSSMQMAAAMKVPAGGTLSILPGQAHLMLRSLKRQPQPGERVTVTLRFSDGTVQPLTLPVRRLP